MEGGAGSSTTNLIGAAFPLLDAPSSFRKQHTPASTTPIVPGTGPVRSLPNQSKLFVEVERLNSRGLALIRRDGSEAEGVTLLGKALWARTRFPVLQKEGDGRLPWEYGEQFVVICNQIASRLVQTLQQASAHTANRIFQCAESALLPGGDDAADSFVDFHPLRQHLLGATLNTAAALQKLNGEPVAAIVPTLERAVRIEGGRYSTLSLYNLGAVYLQAKQYDNACRAVSVCIDLADHYLTLPTTENPAESLKAFQQDVATHAVLGHLLLVTIGLWTKTLPVALKHAKLALSCSLMYLGEKNALTTRCADRLDRVKHVIDRPGTASHVREDAPPTVPLHVPTVGSRGYPPSQLLPYALVLPLPDVVQAYVEAVLSKPDATLLRGDVSVIPRLVEREAASVSPARNRGVADDPTGRLFSQPSVLSTSVLLPEVASSLKSKTSRSSSRPVDAPSSARATFGGARASSSTPADRQTRSTTPRSGVISAGSSQVKSRATPQLQPLRQLQPSAVGQKQVQQPPRRSGTPGTTKSTGSSDCWSPTTEASHPTFDASVVAPGGVRELIPKPPSRGGLQRNNNSSSAVRLHQQAANVTSPTTSSFATTTVLPKAQLLTYQLLQAEVHGMLRPSSGERAGRPTAAVGPADRVVGPADYVSAQKNVTTQMRGPAFALSRGLGSQRTLFQSSETDTAAAAYNHTNVHDVLRVSDAQLRQLSVLVPDHTDADEVMWHHCATQIQKVFRSFRVRKYVTRPKHDATRRWVGVIPAAERIMLAWQTYIACREAVALKYRLRRERFLRDAAVVVQACARQHLGELELRRRYMQAADEHIQRLRRLQLVGSSAVFLQAWWRGCAVRTSLRQRNRSARRIQRVYRLFRLFLIVRLAVLRRRMRKREFSKLLYNTASHIQRWWWHYLPQRRAMQELRRRQAALGHHMDDFLARDRQYWESVRHLDDDACRVIVQRWSAAFYTRKRLHRALFLKRRRLGAARIIQRWYRFAHSRHSLNRRIVEYQQRQLIHRRAEEVREAVFDVQRCSRGLEARRQVRMLSDNAKTRQAAALTIQRAARRMLRRGVVRLLRSREAHLSTRYLAAQTRTYAATQIQSTWRMHTSRRSTIFFKQFMTTDRHTFASKIQRLVRYVQASSRAKALRRSHAESLIPRYREEEAYCASRRIQCAVRMMLCRNELRVKQNAQLLAFEHALALYHREGAAAASASPVRPPRRLLFPTKSQRRVAAQRIQCTWRRFAANMYTAQLRQATQWIDSERISSEHLHAYATVLQCAVRRYIITPIIVAQAKVDREARAAVRIQRAAKLYLDRRRALLRLLQQEEEDVLQWLMEEHNFAAIRVQKHIRGFITRCKYEAFRDSVVLAQAVARGYLARRQRHAREALRSAASAEVLATEERNAAVTIQRAWRGASPS